MKVKAAVLVHSYPTTSRGGINMRRLQLLLIVLVTGSFLLYGQNRVTIDNFDSLHPDSA
jgi:hypothetical protein